MPDGTFRLQGLAAGYYSVVVRGEDYVPHCFNFVANLLEKCGTDVAQEFALQAGVTKALPVAAMTHLAPPVSRFTGTVLESSGKPLKGVRVRLAGVEPETVTRSSGTFTIKGRLDAGQHTIQLFDPKRRWATHSFRIDVVPGQTYSNLDVKLRSAVGVKFGVKTGKGTAKVAALIARKATGSGPSGTLTVSYKDISAEVPVKKGKATVHLKGLPSGQLKLTAVYSGTRTTASTTRTIVVKVK
jgi:hypothetical protein